jgi:hypothetical protein
MTSLPAPAAANRLAGSQKVKDKTAIKYTYAGRDMKVDHKNRASYDNKKLLSHELSPDFIDKMPVKGASFISSPYRFGGVFAKSQTPQDIDTTSRSSLI